MKNFTTRLCLVLTTTALLSVPVFASETKTAFTASNGVTVSVSANERLTTEGVAEKISSLQDANAQLVQNHDTVISAHPNNAAVIQKVTDSTNIAVETHNALIEYYENYTVSATAPTPPASAELTYKQAEEIAVTEVGGGTVLETEVESDDGLLIYEVKVMYDGQDHKIEIDAVTGTVLKHKTND